MHAGPFFAVDPQTATPRRWKCKNCGFVGVPVGLAGLPGSCTLNVVRTTEEEQMETFENLAKPKAWKRPE